MQINCADQRRDDVFVDANDFGDRRGRGVTWPRLPIRATVGEGWSVSGGTLQLSRIAPDYE
jgi:hypothetical protein